MYSNCRFKALISHFYNFANYIDALNGIFRSSKFVVETGLFSWSVFVETRKCRKCHYYIGFLKVILLKRNKDVG